LWLPLGVTGITVLEGSPDLANREQAMVSVSSKVVTPQAPIWSKPTPMLVSIPAISP